MSLKLDGTLLSQINCPTCLANINSGLVTPGRLVQMDIGYDGFKVFRVGSIRLFVTEARQNYASENGARIVHLNVPLIDFDHSPDSPTGLQRHQYITDGLRPDPPVHAFFHKNICPRVNKYEAAPFPNRKRRSRTTSN